MKNFKITLLAFFTVSALIITSCQKDPMQNPGAGNPDTSDPPIEYTHFNDLEVGFNQSFKVDLNHDDFTDFSVYSMMVGDPVLKVDYHQYYFGSAYFTNFPVNSKEEAPLLNKGDSINVSAFPHYNWYNASDIVMAQKVVGMDESHWEGLLKNAYHKYLPLRVTVGKELFYGWIEISFNTLSEKIILHNAAISKEAGKAIQAGQ